MRIIIHLVLENQTNKQSLRRISAIIVENKHLYIILYKSNNHHWRNIMPLLVKYEDFIDRVNELGFMAFSHIIPGFPSLVEETSSNAWHTGEIDTDPWCWKDRAADEKKIAYGCILGGNKGFVSAQMYPYFYKAFQPIDTMSEQWLDGVLNQTIWDLWQLFERQHSLDTGSIRYEMGVTKKKGGSRVDSSIQELQRKFYITVAGNRRKIDKNGQPYGWPHVSMKEL